MFVSSLLKKDKPLFSCEFFPPKTDKGEAKLWHCLQELEAIKPDYVSVTYGAGGSTQDRTRNMVTRIKKETKLEPVAHLTCVGSSPEQLNQLLDEYQAAGIENLLALRGDAPAGEDSFQSSKSAFSYASDLVDFIQQRKQFGIAVATYPEGHPESTGGVADDLRYLKLKQDRGASLAITQYFFDNDHFLRFRDQAIAAGIHIPLIPGIMPIGNYEQIIRFSAMCGASIPDSVHKIMQPIANDLSAVHAAGIDMAIKQCRQLHAEGVAGLHIYTLNKPEASLAIAKALT